MTLVTCRLEVLFRRCLVLSGILVTSRSFAQVDPPAGPLVLEWEKAYEGDLGYSVDQTRDGGYVLSAPNEEQQRLIRTDDEGNIIFKKPVLPRWLDRVRVTRDGGFILVGRTNERSNNFDYFAKHGPEGDLLWRKTLDLRAAVGVAVEATTDGGVIVAGDQSDGNGGIDAVLIKTDRVGEILWRLSPPRPEFQHAHAVRETVDGGYIAAGSTLFKTDSNGILVWEKTFGGAGTQIGLSVVESRDGSFVVGGRNGVLKTTSTGELIWEKTFLGKRIIGIRETPDGGYIAAAHSSLTGIDSEGNEIWTNLFPDIAFEARPTSDGGFVLVGGTFRFDADSNVYLAKLAPDKLPANSLRRGDVDDNGTMQLTDAVRVLGFLFRGGGGLPCAEAADADDNGVVQLADAVRILTFLFAGGAAIPAPGPENCGPDPQTPGLGCAAYTSC